MGRNERAQLRLAAQRGASGRVCVHQVPGELVAERGEARDCERADLIVSEREHWGKKLNAANSPRAISIVSYPRLQPLFGAIPAPSRTVTRRFTATCFSISRDPP